MPCNVNMDIFVSVVVNMFSNFGGRIAHQGAFYPELPSSVLTVCVNPVPYLFIIKGTSHGGFRGYC